MAAEPVAQAFSTRGRFEAQVLVRLQYERCGEILHHEAAVEMTDIDLINIRGGDVRIDQCVGHGIND